MRKDYATKEGKRVVCLRYTAYKRSTLISLNVAVFPTQWNSVSNTVSKKVPFSELINKNIFEIHQKANLIVIENFFKLLCLPGFAIPGGQIADYKSL